MKTFLLIPLCAVGLMLSACETTRSQVVAPSTAGVKSKISDASSSVSQASGAVSRANAASERSSQHIRTFRSKAEQIDYKATRALELL